MQAPNSNPLPSTAHSGRPPLSLGFLLVPLALVLAGCATPPPAPVLVAPSAAANLVAPGTEPPAAAQTPATVPTPSPSSAPDQAQQAQGFARWLEEFRAFARTAGITEATLSSALDSVQLLPRVISQDSAQPEFTRPVWDYLDGALSATRISRATEKRHQWQAVLQATTARYGVPGEILVAIWGLESNFGANMGSIPTVDALATLGFEGRRASWARGQLVSALKILQNGDIGRDQMLGSWAGAMGQTQFLPSSYLAYAVDADGDGRRDIWGNVDDVLASTANLLAKSGWRAGQPWGLEVRLPAGFDYARADAGVRQTAAAWQKLGLQTYDGAPLPALDDSYVLLPAGAAGPAFLVGPNFRAILRYNNATSYALAVALLAQNLAGGPAVQAAWPREVQMLGRSQLQALQTALNALGFDCGAPDGMLGPATRQGVRQYQHSQGLAADGYPTLALLQRLQ